MSSYKKVVRSAVVVVPPKELWGQIQAIREDNDKAFARWPPHINMYVFPAGDQCCYQLVEAPKISIRSFTLTSATQVIPFCSS